MTSVADLKHDDEVLRHGGISHLAARIKGDAARGASHGVMDVEDVHGVYCSGVAIPEPGTGSASCPHRYASLHDLLAIQGICGEVNLRHMCDMEPGQRKTRRSRLCTALREIIRVVSSVRGELRVCTCERNGSYARARWVGAT
ncbi:hypothetical protein B0H13DRAFT_2324376 [Mycena leptocephala]|nr:hypothetical protein B0H13DRAFT_2324376 [Mycena leptocephala]